MLRFVTLAVSVGLLSPAGLAAQHRGDADSDSAPRPHGTTFSQAADIGSIANAEDVVIGARPGSDWYSGSLDEASIQIG